jgi:hypothetical protein
LQPHRAVAGRHRRLPDYLQDGAARGDGLSP